MRKANLLTVGAILIFFLLVCAPYAAASLCGDFDGDEALSIFDITGLISFLYLSGPSRGRSGDGRCQWLGRS